MTMTGESGRELTTIEANRLMEHEAAIERSLSELGWHLRAIRDQRLYRQTHATFEDYCQARWDYSRAYVNRQIAAAETIEVLPLAPMGAIPTERQVRPLSALPEAERAEAWEEAVDEFGDEPTGREVAQVVQRRTQGDAHPATFSRPLMDAIIGVLDDWDAQRILDPFAGTGLVHEIADKVEADSIGVEIEPEWASSHPRTICADARTITADLVGWFDTIVTSPTYGNRMADHHEATDDSDRATYRHRLGRDLTIGNAGALQWGEDYRRLHETVWERVVGLLPSDGLFVLNVKDHIRDGQRQNVSAWHVRTLLGLGLKFLDDASIPSRGLASSAGENGDVRSGIEHIYVLARHG